MAKVEGISLTKYLENNSHNMDVIHLILDEIAYYSILFSSIRSSLNASNIIVLPENEWKEGRRVSAIVDYEWS